MDLSAADRPGALARRGGGGQSRFMAPLDAFLPTLGLIGLGAALRAYLIPKDEVWAGFDRLTFWVLLPALLTSSISTIRLSDIPLGRMAATIWIAVALGTAVALLLSRALGHGHAAMTSVAQGSIRFNTFVALAIAGGLYGEKGLAIGGVTAGLIVPCVQVVLTVIFASGTGRRLSPLRLLVQVFANPLFLGCLAGFAFAAAGGMPPGLGPAIKILGQGSVALGLLCVGAGLSLRALSAAPLTQILVAIQKLAVLPAATFALATAFRLDPIPATLAILFMAMPTATTGYIMARAMGGDARLMAAMIAFQHVAALATVPVWVWLLVG
jgi:malonate transporter